MNVFLADILKLKQPRKKRQSKRQNIGTVFAVSKNLKLKSINPKSKKLTNSMPKFRINFAEINQGSVVVQAFNKDEAKQKWEEAVFDGKSTFGNSELQFKTIEKEG